MRRVHQTGFGKIVIASVLLVFAVSLSACGRKGPLESPDGAVKSTSQDKSAEDANKKIKNDRRFILDGLI